MAIDVRSRLGITDEVLAEFCRNLKITELSLFGSALRDDFGPDSDIDLLVVFEEGADWRFRDLLHMQDEIESLLGRPVDLVKRHLVEESENYIRRKHILSSLQPLYRR
jgi:predicted nucleotidyltransferase